MFEEISPCRGMFCLLQDENNFLALAFLLGLFMCKTTFPLLLWLRFGACQEPAEICISLLIHLLLSLVKDLLIKAFFSLKRMARKMETEHRSKVDGEDEVEGQREDEDDVEGEKRAVGVFSFSFFL